MGAERSNDERLHGAADEAAAAAPNAAELGRLMIAWRAALFRRALAILRDEAAAHDAVQAALLIYWQRREDQERGACESVERPAPLCMGILVRLALNERRERARRARLEAEAARSGRAALPAPATDPADIAAAGEVWEHVLQLPARERDILITRYGLGRTQQETAEELQLPLGTVKTGEHRALRRLRKRYGVTLPGVAAPSVVLLMERLASLGAVPADYAATAAKAAPGSLGALLGSAASLATSSKGPFSWQVLPPQSRWASLPCA